VTSRKRAQERERDIRVLGYDIQGGQWTASGGDVLGVYDLGDGISAAASRGVRLLVSEEVYEEMLLRGDAWLPRPKSVWY
jgi:hypothetical protein